MPARKGDQGPPTGDGPLSPYVERLRPDPSQPAQPVLTMAGLLGESDRAGFRRIYFTRALDHYAEIKTEDILDLEVIPPERPPFVGLESARLTIKRDAPISYTHDLQGPVNPWDIDITGVASNVPLKYVRTGYVGCLERISVADDCPTQPGTTCFTCHGAACHHLTRQFSCDFRICPHGGEDVTAGSTCVTCTGGECPDSLVSCKPCFPQQITRGPGQPCF
jgi:hypothetical protein